jgi:hypothetical protein
MIDHRQAIDLAAASIDFVLDEIDRQSLDDHLRACAPCRAEALALRGDAEALAVLPAIAPPTWVRRAVGRRYGPRRAVLLVAAALVLGATIGAALAVGAVLRHDVAPDVSPSRAPRPTLASVGPSPSAVASQSLLSSPLPSVGPLPIPTAASFPTTSGSAWMGASPDGGTWVMTVHDGGSVADPTSVSVVGLIDSSGRPRPGWPIALTGWRCGEDGPPRALPVASDGSIRLICAEDNASGGPQRHAGFAFDAAGRALPGWPVELPGTGLTTSAMVVGDELRVVASEIASLDGQTSPEQAAAWWLVAVSANGDVRLGRRYEVADAAGSFDVRIAADGIAYRLAFTVSADTVRTEITAFDLDGVRPGWPVTVDGITSQPAIGPNGALVVVRLTKGQQVTAQVLSIAPTGGNAVVASGDLPLDPFADRTGAGSVLIAPIVAGDGGVWVVGTFGSTKPSVVRIVPGTGIGPRISLAMPLQPQGSCSAQDTGCGVWRSLPVAGADGTLYVPESAVGEGGGLTSSAGGSLVALGPDGKTSAGWPVFLPDSMAGYWSLLSRSDGTVDAFAVVPIDSGNQWSLGILGTDGKTRASIPVIAP